MKKQQDRNKITDIIIVGAGASGLMAAIMAAREGASVLVLEHMDCAAKKILVTGNGRCNFTNKEQGMQFYRGTYPAFILKPFERFGLNETLDFFRGIGIIPKEKNGYYYPYNEEASAVRAALLRECEASGVKILYNIGIRKITFEKDRFLFDTKTGFFESICCILATGGKAASKTGSDGSGFLYLDNFRQPCTDIVPSLVQLKGKQPFFKEIAGIRANVSLKLFTDSTPVAEESGELQLTDYGISGIPVFQISRFAALALREQKKVTVLIDFLPEWRKEEAETLFNSLLSMQKRDVTEALSGILHQKMIPLILKLSGIENKPAVYITEKERKRLVSLIKAFEVTVAGTNSFDKAQVTAGGVDTAYVSDITMESKLQKNLFFCGEILDIDGMCGGYNLQWAWTSGAVAGKSAAAAAKY